MSGKRAKVVYFSHGGGPLPLLGDASHRVMVDFMTGLPSRIGRPEAILVVSAHWEEDVATVLGAPYPSMFYDYYGFPDEAYAIDYPAPGSPELAGRIAGLLEKEGMATKVDSQRGFDHGLFIPLKLMYPEADIPSLQLSLLRGLDPGMHLRLGRALRELHNENVLIVGSGFSFHNMGAFLWQGGNPPDAENEAFQDWLIETCTGLLSPSERAERMIGWEGAPSARYCHPREEHLIPLHCCLGMAQEPAEKIFDDYILGKRSVAFLW